MKSQSEGEEQWVEIEIGGYIKFVKGGGALTSSSTKVDCKRFDYIDTTTFSQYSKIKIYIIRQASVQR